MKWVLIVISILVIGALGIAAVNFFYQQELVDFLNGLGWYKLAGFASGSWWVNIPTWILALGVLGGLWFTWWQIRETRKSTNAQVAVDLFNRLREDEAVYALRTIYRHEPEDLAILLDIKPEDEKRTNGEKIGLKKGIEYVLDNLELIGALVANEIIDERMAIEAYGGTTVLRCWYVLREYIKKARTQRGGPYCKYLEDFAWRALEHQKKVPQDERILFYKDDPNKPFDLIRYFIENPDKQPKKRT